jgi:uncharacterized membrane protein YhaH (DUF805 family)
MGPANPYQSPQTDVTAPPVDGVDQTGPFDIKGRFGRLSYIAWYLTFTVGLYAIFFVFALIFGVGAGVMGSESPSAGGIVGGIFGILYIAVVIAMLVIAIIFFVRRLHDIDLSGWWALLMLVPLVNAIFGIFAMVKAGTPGANRFGPPRETRGWEQVVGIIGVVLFVLSLVVTIGALVMIAMSPELMDSWSQMP